MQIKCSHCGKILTVPDGSQVAQGKCPHCKETIDLAKAERVGLNPGDALGDFRVDALIGKGGMATVYRGTQVSLDRPVAIKVLAPQLARRAQFVERFQREAKLLAQLSHNNIVGVLSVGTKDDDTYYLAMEFVEGESLRERLRREGRIPFEDAAKLIDGVAAGLEYAHNHDILHRDIKPANILITADGVPKIADFGIARLVGADEAAQQRLTMAQTQMGSAHYMAPEQMKDAATVDHRADIYALGVMFYEMLTGDLPIGQFKPPSRVAPGVPAQVDRIVRQALATSPDERYQTVAQFRALVQRLSLIGLPTRIQEGRPRAAAQPRAAVPRPPRKKKSPLPLLIGSGALVAAAIIIALLVLGGGKPKEQAKENLPQVPNLREGKAPLTQAEKREKAAKDLFNIAFKRLLLRRPNSAKAYLDRLDRDCADTAYYRANRAAIAKLRAELQAKLGKPTPPELPKKKPEPKPPVEPTPPIQPQPKPPAPTTVAQRAAAAGLEQGLAAAFYAGQNFERFVSAKPVSRLNFNWGPEAPMPGVPADGFSARFVGWIHIREAGRYTFRFLRDDGARLYLDGKKVIDQWTVALHGEPASVHLEQGWRRLWVEYMDIAAMAAMVFEWRRDGEDAEVPANLLYCERAVLDRIRRHPTEDPFAALRPTDAPGTPGAPPEPAGEWISVFDGKTLTAWTLVDEFPGLGKGGRTHVDDGRMLLEPGRLATGVRLTRDFPTADYELSVEIMRLAGRDFVCGAVFPVRSSHCFLWLAEPGGGVALSRVDGRMPPNKLACRRMTFENGRWYRVVLRVTEQTITASIDGTKAFEIETRGHAFTLGDYLAPLKPFGLYARGANVAVRKVSFRRLKAEPGGVTQEDPAARAQALFAQGVAVLKPLWQKRQYAEALVKAKQLAAEEECKAAPDAGKWLLLDAEALAGFWEAVKAGAAKLKPGDPFRVRGMLGKITKVEDDKIHVKVGGAEFAKKLAELSDAELVSLARKARTLTDGKDLLALALLELHAKKPDAKRAEAALARAAKAGIDTSRHLALLRGAGGKPTARPPVRPTPGAPKPGKWVSLFDGKTLDGWRPLNEKGPWRVENGEIVGKGAYTSIVNHTTLKPPYTLSLEAMTSKGTGFASGLLFGVRPDPGARSASGYWILLYNLRGYALRLHRGFPGVDDPPPDTLWQSRETRFVGDAWHKLLLHVGKSGVALRVDGRPVFQVRVKQPPAGAVGLVARDTTRFRNIVWAAGIQKSAPRAAASGAFEKAFEAGLAAIAEGKNALAKRAFDKAKASRPADAAELLNSLHAKAMQAAVDAAKMAEWKKTNSYLKFAGVAKPGDADVRALAEWLKAASKPVFADSFDSGKLSRWEVEKGTWRVVGGQLVCNVGHLDATIYLKRVRLKDFVLQFDMMSAGDNYGFRWGVAFRYTPTRFLHFVLSDNENWASVGGSTRWHYGPSGPAKGVDVEFVGMARRFPVESDKFYHVTIRCTGEKYECYLDRKLAVRGSDVRPTSGKVGFHARRADARFDNVRIYRAAPLPKLQFTPPKEAKR